MSLSISYIDRVLLFNLKQFFEWIHIEYTIDIYVMHKWKNIILKITFISALWT